jgi:hypothetical protein
MPDVYVNGKRLRVNAGQAIGKGGEADIYDVGGVALKLFKPPNHPDLVGQPAAQAVARQRLQLHQRKLRAFPQPLPPRVVGPQDLATNQAGDRIVGYTMPLVSGAEVLMRYGDRGFREGTIGNDTVAKVFRDLHGTVTDLHRAGIVIGDFNDLNVLVRGEEALVIDTDSFQFGPYPCEMFTPKFTDPLHCDPTATSLVLSSPHDANSDWYAYAVMLMNSLLYVDPYGGVYRPKDSAHRVVHGARPLRRITVFHPEVRYPKPATPYDSLPDDLCDCFVQVFTQDVRGMYPLHLLDNLRWTTCTTCGAEHARAVCPRCKAAGLVKETIRIRGEVKATKVFASAGRLLATDIQHGKLAWLHHEHGGFYREDGGLVAKGPLGATARYRLSGRRTVIANGHQAVVLTPDADPQPLNVDTVGQLPIIDTNADTVFWAEGGAIYRQGNWDRETIGQVLAGQTLLWTGPEFGFGFYRAGELTGAFVFETRGKTLNDSVQLPRLPDQLTDASCVLTTEHCWLFVSGRSHGKTQHQCILLNRRGVIEASEVIEPDGNHWLSQVRGQAAAGEFLLVATDDGIVRVEALNGQLTVTREFPDTEPFVSSETRLLAGSNGLFAVSAKEIWRLVIS